MGVLNRTLPSVLLFAGAFDPREADLDAEGLQRGPTPDRLVDNEDSLLEATAAA
jgi:hypothetical protein